MGLRTISTKLPFILAYLGLLKPSSSGAYCGQTLEQTNKLSLYREKMSNARQQKRLLNRKWVSETPAKKEMELRSDAVKKRINIWRVSIYLCGTYVRTTQINKLFFPGSTAEIKKRHLTGEKTVKVQCKRTFSIKVSPSSWLNVFTEILQ